MLTNCKKHGILIYDNSILIDFIHQRINDSKRWEETMKEQQIIIAAKRLLGKYGYKRVSMDEIAREAGVTKKTVYSYFKNKEEFLKYFLNEEVQNMKKIVEDTEEEDKSFFENLHKTICEIIKYTQKRNFLQIIMEESESFKNPVIIENLKVINNAIQNYIKEKLEVAVEQKQIHVENIDVMAFLIYKMYIAILLEWNQEGEKNDEKLIADTIIHLLKNGLEIK